MMQDLRKSLEYSRLNDFGLDPCPSYHVVRAILSTLVTWVMADLQNFKFRKMAQSVWYRAI
jgi:hypothetical protein